jgi:hypothetical protein
MQRLLQNPGVTRPLFGGAGFPISVWGVLTGMFVAGIVFLFLGFTTQAGTAGLGGFLLIVSFIGFWIREKLSSWFG